jgi:hypothetical protein
MPSSRLVNIIKMNSEDIRALGKRDMVIISGGSMDINKNGSSSFEELSYGYSEHIF